MKLKADYLFLGLALSCLTAAAWADLPVKVEFEVIKLKNGFNEVHFDGLDYKTLAVVAHRENYNAHSYDVTTLYVDYKPADQHDSSELQIIPIIEKSQKNTLNLLTDGGADCLLDDYRLVSNNRTRETWLIIGQREFGNSFADTQPVNFIFYKLAVSKEQTPGFAPFSFQYWKEQKSKQKYCDIGDAFQKELGFENDRTDTGDQ